MALGVFFPSEWDLLDCGALIPVQLSIACSYDVLFWAAAPKGPMTYAFTYADISPPPSLYSIIAVIRNFKPTT